MGTNNLYNSCKYSNIFGPDIIIKHNIPNSNMYFICVQYLLLYSVTCKIMEEIRIRT